MTDRQALESYILYIYIQFMFYISTVNLLVLTFSLIIYSFFLFVNIKKLIKFETFFCRCLICIYVIILNFKLAWNWSIIFSKFLTIMNSLKTKIYFKNNYTHTHTHTELIMIDYFLCHIYLFLLLLLFIFVLIKSFCSCIFHVQKNES